MREKVARVARGRGCLPRKVDEEVVRVLERLPGLAEARHENERPPYAYQRPCRPVLDVAAEVGVDCSEVDLLEDVVRLAVVRERIEELLPLDLKLCVYAVRVRQSCAVRFEQLHRLEAGECDGMRLVEAPLVRNKSHEVGYHHVVLREGVRRCLPLVELAAYADVLLDTLCDVRPCNGLCAEQHGVQKLRPVVPFARCREMHLRNFVGDVMGEVVVAEHTDLLVVRGCEFYHAVPVHEASTEARL